MKKSAHTLAWLGAIIVIAALAYWFGSRHPLVQPVSAPIDSKTTQASQSSPAAISTKPTATATPLPSEETTTSDTGEILYANNNKGFTLTFPKSWKNFRVETKKTESDGYDYLSFELPLTRGSYGSVFTISFHTLDEWKALQAEGAPMPSRLAGAGDLVYGYSFAQDDTGYAGYPEPVPGLIYKGPIFEAEEMIIPSFRLR